MNHPPSSLIAQIRNCALCILIVLVWGVASGLAQVSAPSGPYTFVSDSDGGKAGKGSFVTLTFTNSGAAIFNAIKKPYLYRLDGTQELETLRDLIVRQFSAMYAERIAHSNYTDKAKLSMTLNLFGGDPV